MTIRDLDRRQFLKAGAAAAVGLLFLKVPAARAGDAFGAMVGCFNCVAAFSNSSNDYFSNQTNYVNGYCTGYRWQCVEFTSRYYWTVYGMRIQGGNANTWYANAASKGLRAFANGGTSRPQVGDVLCSNSGSYGHVAIIREVGPDSCPYVTVIHQNWANSSADNAKTMCMTVSNGRYTIAAASSYSWQGWLRR